MSSSALTLTIVGCAPAWTRRPGRSSSCYLLEIGEDAIVLDLGHGSFNSLSQLRDPVAVRAVLISHLHADHLIDIVPLRYYLRYGCQPPGHVELRGPAGLGERIDGLTGERAFLGALLGPSHSAGHTRIGPYAVELARVTHTESSFGFRVSHADEPAAPGLVYSGDCGDARDLRRLIRPGDVVLSEAFFGAKPPTPDLPHLTSAQAAWAAADGQARELLLTHIQDECDHEAALTAAVAVFPSSLLAEPGMRVAIS
jgi:ribonuclease BN (tRNA processing enzyme)